MQVVKVPGRALEIEDLAFEEQPPSPIVYRRPLGKCGHGEARPGGAREGAHLYSMHQDPSILFSLVGLFSKVKRMKKTNCDAIMAQGSKLPDCESSGLPLCELLFNLEGLHTGRQCG